jgi:hypothetical protein
MAFRLKSWLGVVAVLGVLIVLWRLPLGYVATGPRIAETPEELRHQALASELNDVRALFDRTRRAMTLPELAVASATDGVAAVAPDAVAALERVLRAEVEGLTVRDPAVVIAYAYDTLATAYLDLRARAETYAGVVDGTAYCLQVVTVRPELLGSFLADDVIGRPPRQTDVRSLTRSRLGACRFYASYGAAGTHIQAWLAGGAAAFARSPRGNVSDRYRSTLPRRSFLAIHLAGNEPGLVTEHCWSGDGESCVAAFLDPDLVDPSGSSQRRAARRAPALATGTEYGDPFSTTLLADLEFEFGADAFRRFWTSEDEVRRAFEAAFGVDLGDWLLSWVDREQGLEPATPAPTRSAAFGGLLLVSMATGLAGVLQRRRRVG